MNGEGRSIFGVIIDSVARMNFAVNWSVTPMLLEAPDVIIRLRSENPVLGYIFLTGQQTNGSAPSNSKQ